MAVLDEVRLGRSRSRSELGELIHLGLVRDAGFRDSTGGRPPRQLTFHGDAGHLLVADHSRRPNPAWRDEPADIADGPEWCLARNVVVVKISTGIGAGIIADGRLHLPPAQRLRPGDCVRARRA